LRGRVKGVILADVLSRQVLQWIHLRQKVDAAGNDPTGVRAHLLQYQPIDEAGYVARGGSSPGTDSSGRSSVSFPGPPKRLVEFAALAYTPLSTVESGGA
jgi:hypothetical protein